MDLKNIFGDVIFSATAKTVKDLVLEAIKHSANLRSADLRSANLFGANLSGANLRSADLRSADLRSADLFSADLRGANLSGADLSGADLPAPTIILLASWGEISEQLCADLMEYDCWCHGNRAAFDEFARTHKCPFEGHREQRAANFEESGSIWARQIGKLCSPHDLMLRLFEEKGIKR